MGPGIKEHPFFKDCSKKIEQMCRKALKEKYQEYEGQDLTLDNFIDDGHYRLLGELEQEVRPFRNIKDTFKRIVITGDIIMPHYDESGVLMVNIYDFLLDPTIIESI